MIMTGVILGATIVIGVGLLAKFWNNIISYLKKAIIKVQEMIHTAVVGVKVFLRKTSDGIVQITKNYSRNEETKKWKEQIIRRVLDENDIPHEMRTRLIMEEEFDITDELELQLTGRGG